MPNTFYKIATVDVGSGGAATIQFNSIPQTYTDLKIVASFRVSESPAANYWQNVRVQFNSDTTSNYQSTLTYNANGSTGADGTSSTGIKFIYATFGNATSSWFSNVNIYVPNYIDTTQYKSASIENAAVSNLTTTGYIISTTAGKWNGTGAITSINIEPEVGTGFVQYSSATLYGIKKS